MCNIAGYVGNRPAAPILIDMIRSQEGFNAGFYTGIATMHQGKIYYAKLTGDTDRLVSLTDAAKLPGTVGIIHSRTRSGGGDGWAHPFVGYKNGEVDCAYVANGAAGYFKNLVPKAAEIAAELERSGYPMNCKLEGEKRASYPILPDGRSVHMSDVMCQLITRNIARGGDPVSSMGDAFCRMPSEIVGLMLSLAEPDGIVWSRINCPMMLSFAEHGAYLATTAMAFPEDHGDVQSLPPLASGCVYRDREVCAPYAAPPTAVGEADPSMIERAYELICDALSKQTMRFSEIEKLAATLFSPSDCPQDALVSYEILRSLSDQGRLEVRGILVPGVAEGLSVPKFTFALK